MFLRAMCFFFLLFLKTKIKKNTNKKTEKQNHANKKMEMTLMIKSKNVCFLYLPVISRGGRGGIHGVRRIDNT